METSIADNLECDIVGGDHSTNSPDKVLDKVLDEVLDGDVDVGGNAEQNVRRASVVHAVDDMISRVSDSVDAIKDDAKAVSSSLKAISLAENQSGDPADVVEKGSVDAIKDDAKEVSSYLKAISLAENQSGDPADIVERGSVDANKDDAKAVYSSLKAMSLAENQSGDPTDIVEKGYKVSTSSYTPEALVIDAGAVSPGLSLVAATATTSSSGDNTEAINPSLSLIAATSTISNSDDNADFEVGFENDDEPDDWFDTAEEDSQEESHQDGPCLYPFPNTAACARNRITEGPCPYPLPNSVDHFVTTHCALSPASADVVKVSATPRDNKSSPVGIDGSRFSPKVLTLSPALASTNKDLCVSGVGGSVSPMLRKLDSIINHTSAMKPVAPYNANEGIAAATPARISTTRPANVDIMTTTLESGAPSKTSFVGEASLRRHFLDRQRADSRLRDRLVEENKRLLRENDELSIANRSLEHELSVADALARELAADKIRFEQSCDALAAHTKRVELVNTSLAASLEKLSPTVVGTEDGSCHTKKYSTSTDSVEDALFCSASRDAVVGRLVEGIDFIKQKMLVLEEESTTLTSINSLLRKMVLNNGNKHERNSGAAFLNAEITPSDVGHDLSSYSMNSEEQYVATRETMCAEDFFQTEFETDAKEGYDEQMQSVTKEDTPVSAQQHQPPDSSLESSHSPSDRCFSENNDAGEAVKRGSGYPSKKQVDENMDEDLLERSRNQPRNSGSSVGSLSAVVLEDADITVQQEQQEQCSDASSESSLNSTDKSLFTENGRFSIAKKSMQDAEEDSDEGSSLYDDDEEEEMSDDSDSDFYSSSDLKRTRAKEQAQAKARRHDVSNSSNVSDDESDTEENTLPDTTKLASLDDEALAKTANSFKWTSKLSIGQTVARDAIVSQALARIRSADGVDKGALLPKLTHTDYMKRLARKRCMSCKSNAMCLNCMSATPYPLMAMTNAKKDTFVCSRGHHCGVCHRKLLKADNTTKITNDQPINLLQTPKPKALKTQSDSTLKLRTMGKENGVMSRLLQRGFIKTPAGAATVERTPLKARKI